MANLWDPDIEFGDADARRLLETQFPEHSGAKLEPFGKGWDNRLYLMDNEWVLRFPVRHIAGPLIKHEAVALPYLSPQLPLPVPRPDMVGVPDDDYPFDWLGYRRIDGEVLCRLDPLPASPKMANQIGEFLRALHHADPSPVALPGDIHSKADLPARFEQLSERVERLVADGALQPDTGSAVLELAKELSEAAPWPDQPRIVHGDLYGYHVLSDGETVTGVIDWGDVHLGDPAQDLSIAYGWFQGDARQALFDSYGPIDHHAHARARFRALCYAPVLILYGRDIDDPAVELTGRRALGALD